MKWPLLLPALLPKPPMSRSEQLIHGVRRLLTQHRQDMRVGVHRDTDLRVPQHLHNDPIRNETVEHGLTAFSFDRKTEASLLSHAADLDQLLSDRYPDERLADEFHQRYRDARTALRHKAHADS